MSRSLFSKATLCIALAFSGLTGCSMSDYYAEQAECLKPQGPYPASCGVNYNGPTGELVLSQDTTGGNPDIRYLTAMQSFYPDAPISVEQLVAVAKAAEQGDEGSIMALGRLYYEIGHHYTTCSVVKTGQNWLKLGSDMQLPHPKVLLSQHYFSGICMPINVTKALQLAREARAIDDDPIIIEWLEYASNPDNQVLAERERAQQLEVHQGKRLP
ncbi:hypothetical protein ACLPHM_02600 [Paenalcaligenes sp. Me131]|uniref:hypothetical protein n=1 Tax=Paenalcaligenes sp. Me131 TaxID=3392636 RepID=UPI003D2C084A